MNEDRVGDPSVKSTDTNTGLTMDTHTALGFFWDRDAEPINIPVHEVRRTIFRFSKMLPTFVWDASVIEGNPFTLPEIQTIIDGITVGGRKISDAEQVINLIKSSRHLINKVRSGQFELTRNNFAEIHAIVAREEALEWGNFRGEGQETHYTPNVGLGARGKLTPLPTQAGGGNLISKFNDGLSALQTMEPFERARAFFLFGALQQFYFDGNKRTSRFMMNGILMSNGIDAISVPAGRAQEFNERMVDFYVTKNATEMMEFLVDCHPEVDDIHLMNPHLYKTSSINYPKG